MARASEARGGARGGRTGGTGGAGAAGGRAARGQGRERDEARAPREARATQRRTRQSPYKMRLVIDQIRGKDVNEALALLKFSKKHAAKEIEKTLASAVANAEHLAREASTSIDVDRLYVKHAVINEGPKLKRFTPAAMGRATPILKRTSHVEIVVAERQQRAGR